MVDVRTPTTVGAGAAILYAVGTVVPYVAGEIPPGARQTYYAEIGPVGPPYVAVLALVAFIVFAAGREGRAAPDLVAGVGIAIGVVVTSLTAMWAFGGAASVVGSLSTAAWLEYHRWVLLASAFGVFASAAWLGHEIGVLEGR